MFSMTTNNNAKQDATGASVATMPAQAYAAIADHVSASNLIVNFNAHADNVRAGVDAGACACEDCDEPEENKDSVSWEVFSWALQAIGDHVKFCRESAEQQTDPDDAANDRASADSFHALYLRIQKGKPLQEGDLFDLLWILKEQADDAALMAED